MGNVARWRAAFAVTAVACVLVCSAVPAGAATPTAWTPVPSPNPGTNDLLFGVSCATPTLCLAVGRDENVDLGETALVEAWDGVTWNSSVLKNDAKTLADVSCASPRWCVAVGDAALPGADGPAAVETWDGEAWTLAALPNVRRYNSLLGVSCVSASWCVGVGYSTDFLGSGHTVGQYKTLVVTWDGSRWDVVPTPNRDTANVLTDVSCATVMSCVAVGYTNVDLGFDEHGERLGVLVHTLTETWDGTSWTIIPSPNPSLQSSALQGVSCATTNSCVAVGNYESVGGINRVDATLVETWDGATWNVAPSPSPGAKHSLLFDVSCAGRVSCAAVGNTSDSEGAARSLVETWDGSSWSVATTPSPEFTDALGGVSCPTAVSCVAVGARYTANFGSVKTLILSNTPYKLHGFDARITKSRWKPGRTVPVKFTLADENGAPLTDQVTSVLSTRVQLWSKNDGATVLGTASCAHHRTRFACDLRLPSTLTSGTYWIAAQAQLGDGSWVTLPPPAALAVR